MVSPTWPSHSPETSRETSRFPEQVAEFGDRLKQIRRQAPDEVALPDILGDLETAYEELRVADEEVRTQQEQITQLLERQNLVHWQHERMLAILPVPALVTDRVGTIRYVNAHAAALVGRRVAHLLGTPVFAFFTASERRTVRTLVHADSPDPVRQFSTLQPRDGEPFTVEVFVAARHPDEVTWLLQEARSPETGPDLADVAQVLVRLAGLPGTGADRQQVLNEAAAICARTLGGVDVTISMGAPDEPVALASTTQLAQDLDGAQLVAGDGPALTAFRSRATVSSADLRRDARWPALAAVLAPDPPVGVVVVPIEVGPRLVGTLHVYGGRVPVPVDSDDLVELLAATLGALLYELELNDEVEKLGQQMELALASRSEIDQAKGIIMAQRGCSADEAFAYLTSISSAHERKVRDVAHTIVERVRERGV